jgi:hypothetical protein
VSSTLRTGRQFTAEVDAIECLLMCVVCRKNFNPDGKVGGTIHETLGKKPEGS